jgi:Tol biopolymer transport system component/tRNA A-37 threonylcarbamoyl transferase component Bud32
MPLSAGTKLGPYEILTQIGAGGMGEVYKARDTRLDRIVAIKVSKTEFSERFEREARAVAALNHPHICQLYDVGPNYLVMEYVEGAPLKGPLPLEQALKYAVQICDALDAAHKKGITHRDLKPANILATKAGIKLLDFGLAKLASAGVGQAAKPSDDVTLTMALTGRNEIVGTLYYMSPEQLQAQANGQEIDARSDIFSFGLVLYEILTGKRAFEGSSPASVIAAIMERPAPSIGTIAPPALDWVMQTCLAKDPEERWQSARDLKAALEWIASAPEPGRTAPSPSRLGRLTGIVAAVLAIALAVAGLGWWRAAHPSEAPLRPLVRLDVDLGADVSLGSQAGAAAVLSPDGTRLVYVSEGRLLTRRLDQPKAAELAGTEGAFAPFFSPDGQWVAFFAGGSLKKVSMEGGAAITLSSAPFATGGSWGEDGNIVAAFNTVGALWRIPSSGGTPAPVTELAQGENTHRWPQILPGGKAVLFTAHSQTSGFDGANIEVISLGDHRRKTLLRGGTFGRYLPSGHLIYVNRGTLFAVPFDLERLEVRGTPAPVLGEVGYSSTYGSAQLDFSRSGTLVYRSGTAGGGQVTVQWLDGTGRTQPLLAKPGLYTNPHVSPDGQRLAMLVTSGSNTDAWTYEWQRDTMTRLTFTGRAGQVIWSPDGRFIVFLGEAGGMLWARSDGAGKPQPLTQTKNFQVPWSFSPDGKRLAFFETNAGTGNDLWTVPLESDGAGLRAGKPEIFLQTTADERYPSFSPDGRWLAYTSDESGAYQVYVRAFPDRGGKWQISNSGGAYPAWSSNGRELLFRTLDNRIMVATYTAKGDSFVSDKPRVWSERRLADFGAVGVATYDVAPDGKRVAALMPVEAPETQKAQNHVIFLENFFDELRRKVPVSK